MDLRARRATCTAVFTFETTRCQCEFVHLSPVRSCRQRRERYEARIVDPTCPPCWASSLMARRQEARNTFLNQL